MALYPNGSYMSRSPGRHFGGVATAVNGVGVGFSVRLKNRSDRLNRFVGSTASKLDSVPSGYGVAAYIPARVAGGMSSFNKIIGSGAVSPSMLLVQEMLATIVGEGGIVAVGGLIVNMIATISGSGGVTSAQVSAYLNMLATIGGSGGITATPSGIGEMIAAISGAGDVTNSTATGIGNMSATLRGYGDLTPEGIRDSVWGALLSQYQTAGSAGKALSTAGSGGVDLNALAAAVWEYAMESGLTAEQFMRVMGAAMAGKVSGAGTGTETFKGLDGTTDRIVSTVDSNGNRTNVVVNGS